MAIKRIVVVGCTGDGKSTFANFLLHSLGYPGAPPFSDGVNATSHTHDVNSLLYKDYEVVDTPGLTDTKGTQQDVQNINKIVQYVKAKGSITAFILVINDQAEGFDKGIQDAILLLSNSFGPKMWDNTCIVFTKSMGMDFQTAAAKARNGIVPFLRSRTAMRPVAYLPCNQFDCHPDLRGEQGVPVDRIIEIKTSNNQRIQEVLHWIRKLNPVDTTQAVTYEEQQRLREEEETRAAAEREAASARALAELQRLGVAEWLAAEQARAHAACVEQQRLTAEAQRQAAVAQRELQRWHHETFYRLASEIKIGGKRLW